MFTCGVQSGAFGDGRVGTASRVGDPDRIGLVDTVRWLIGIEEGDLTDLIVNPSRRGRVEPRVVKRRPKQYSRMTKPRAELHKSLPMKNFSSASLAFGTFVNIAAIWAI